MKLSSGSYDLNKWLHGGYDCDIITTFYGPGGSGKTNFCMVAAASQARKGNKVIFVDTEGGFSVERFKQIVGNDYESALSNILLLKPTSFYEQTTDFKRLLKEIKDQPISLVIVDGMTMLYRLELAEANKDENKEKVRKINGILAWQLRNLAEIARKKEIPVIITNQVYSDFDNREKVNMVGGDILKYWSKCIIEVKRDSYSHKRRLLLRKHRSLPEKDFNFEISDLGIRKKGLF